VWRRWYSDGYIWPVSLKSWLGLDRATERRSASFQDVWGKGYDPDSILGTGSAGSLSLIPLFAAHRTIIDLFCSTPMQVFRNSSTGDAKRIATPKMLTPVFGLPYTDKSQIVGSMLYDGNAFGLVTTVGVVWLDPDRVAVQDDDCHKLPVWMLDGRVMQPGEILHIPWIVPVGKVRGLSPIKAFRKSFETGDAAQTMARDWFKNGAIPAAHLQAAGNLDPESASVAKTRYKSAVSGRDVFVSGDDWTLKTIGLPADEARFIETLKLNATQIAAIYGLPPEEIGGERGSSLTYSTLESDEMRINSRVLRPWTTRVEEALTTLLPPSEYVKFNLDARVRTDLMTRMQAHEIAMRIGLETLDEGRKLEERPVLTNKQKSEWQAMYGIGGNSGSGAK
jgi:HK97 family phage portal protein